MINIVLFGPPGAGKGTQAELVVSQEELIHISTGDIFRKNIKEKTELGEVANTYMRQGQLVPDKVTIDLLAKELDTYISSQGFIFDGFPRTIKQAETFDNLLISKNMPLSLVISLEVNEDELVKRLLNRGIDSGREDDKNKNIIRNRIQVYEKQTSVLKTYYLQRLKTTFIPIDGEQNISQVSKKILATILDCKTKS
mgnify:CR=1 FL=1